MTPSMIFLLLLFVFVLVSIASIFEFCTSLKMVVFMLYLNGIWSNGQVVKALDSETRGQNPHQNHWVAPKSI